MTDVDLLNKIRKKIVKFGICIYIYIYIYIYRADLGASSHTIRKAKN